MMLFSEVKSIENLLAFDSAYELIRDAIGDLELTENYTEEEIEQLKNIDDDYDPMRFFLLNYQYVIICEAFCGDVSGEILDFDDFLKNTMDYVKEELKKS